MMGGVSTGQQRALPRVRRHEDDPVRSGQVGVGQPDGAAGGRGRDALRGRQPGLLAVEDKRAGLRHLGFRQPQRLQTRHPHNAENKQVVHVHEEAQRRHNYGQGEEGAEV